MGHVVKLLKAATGWDTNLWELLLVGERRINLMRAFNYREGFNESDDVLPDRIFEGLVGGSSEGQAINKEEFYKTRKMYYQLAGLHPDNGNPTRVKLMELGLDWVEKLLDLEDN